MSVNKLERKVSELRELRRVADELAAEIVATADVIPAPLGGNHNGRMETTEEAGYRHDGKCPVLSGTVGDGHRPADDRYCGNFQLLAVFFIVCRCSSELENRCCRYKNNMTLGSKGGAYGTLLPGVNCVMHSGELR